MMVYIRTKFHENILDGIRVMERTRKVIGRTDGGHDIIRHVFDGRIKIQRTREKPHSMPHSCLYFINRKPEKEKNIL